MFDVLELLALVYYYESNLICTYWFLNISITRQTHKAGIRDQEHSGYRVEKFWRFNNIFDEHSYFHQIKIVTSKNNYAVTIQIITLLFRLPRRRQATVSDL